MKKTNFRKSLLASSALLAIVALIALSTATFAWYTAQNSVNATHTKVQSAVSSSKSIALDTINSGTETKGTKVTLSLAKSDIDPMVPKTSPTVTSPTVSGTGYGAFVSDFTKRAINAEGKFTEDGEPAMPNTIKGVDVDTGTDDDTTDTFLVVNTNGSSSTGISVAVTIEDGYEEVTFGNDDPQPTDWAGNYYNLDSYDSPATEYAAGTTYHKVNAGIKNALRVAVFVGDTSGSTSYIGTWGAEAADTHFGYIKQGATGTTLHTAAEGAETTTPYNCTGSATYLCAGDIMPEGAKYIKAVIWFNGPSLGNRDAGAFARFTIQFNAINTGGTLGTTA